MRKILASAAVFLLFLVPVVQAASQFPSPVGFVNDFAGVLPDRAAMEQQLEAYERNTTVELVVITLSSLPADQTAATYANEVFQAWGVGKKGEDNGIVVLIVANGTTGNRLRIELGYGIQGYITGAESGRILDEALPYYQQGDYQTAANIIVARLMQDLHDYSPQNPVQPGTVGVSNQDLIFTYLPFIAVFILPFVFAAISGRSQKCPNCGSGDVKCTQDNCVCQNCGRKFKKKRGAFIFVPLFLGGGGGGGGFGGFGGGGSGGGGAGR